MKKVLNYFFVTLGVIFFCLILFSVWFYIADPLNLKPIYQMLTTESVPEVQQVDETIPAGDEQPTADVVVDRNPALNTEQEQALDSVGIDPASLPTTITPTQQECFIEVLGQARVEEIVSGDTPTATEFFRARGCLEV